jgi:hypothetical protein
MHGRMPPTFLRQKLLAFRIVKQRGQGKGTRECIRLYRVYEVSLTEFWGNVCVFVRKTCPGGIDHRLICGVNEWQGGTISAMIDGSEYEEKDTSYRRILLVLDRPQPAWFSCILQMILAFLLFSVFAFFAAAIINARRNAAMTNSVREHSKVERVECPLSRSCRCGYRARCNTVQKTF